MVHVPSEIIQLILVQVEEINGKIPPALLRINSDWFHAAVPFVYRSVRLFTRKNFLSALTALQRSPRAPIYAAYIFELSVSEKYVNAGHEFFGDAAAIEFFHCLFRAASVLSGTGVSWNSTEMPGSVQLPSSLRIHKIDLRFCQTLHDATVDAVAASCGPTLQHLLLRESRSVTDGGLRTLSEACSSGLSTLQLHTCTGLTARGISTFMEKAGRKLQNLALASIFEVSDETVRIIAEQCPELEQLDITRCWHVTDKSLEILASHCSRLRKLGISYCVHVTERGAGKIIHKCRCMETIEVVNTGLMSMFRPAIYARWRELRPGLQIVDSGESLLTIG